MHTTRRIGIHGARGLAALALVLATLALLPAQALAQAQGAAVPPRLSSLSIEIWPEYDRPSAALVILKGEVAADVKLPVKMALRLPKASGAPSAVAFFQPAGGSPLNMEHRVEGSGDAIAVHFEVPERAFLVEFYEPIATGTSARGYTYTWPGDVAVERAGVVVQEPATATNVETQPKPEQTRTGSDGLNYFSAQVGALAAGKPLAVSVRYTKEGQRTSMEIMKPKAGAPAPAATPTGPAQPMPAGGAPIPGSVIALVAVALLSIAGALILFWWSRRSAAPAATSRGACTKCGTPRRAGDRFCGKCGAKLA